MIPLRVIRLESSMGMIENHNTDDGDYGRTHDNHNNYNNVSGRVNRNTDFRKKANGALWSVWIAVLGILGKMIFWN